MQQIYGVLLVVEEVSSERLVVNPVHGLSSVLVNVG